MKMRAVVLTVVTCFVALTLSFAADDPLLGTWKLNEAKSKLVAGGPKNNTVIYEAAGDSIKCTIEGVDAKGNPTHIEWTGKFDGQDYPLTGDPNGDMRAYKKIGNRSMEGITKKNGKVTSIARVVVATNGKSRTVSVNLTDADGKKSQMVAVYDRE